MILIHVYRESRGGIQGRAKNWNPDGFQLTILRRTQEAAGTIAERVLAEDPQARPGFFSACLHKKENMI